MAELVGEGRSKERGKGGGRERGGEGTQDGGRYWYAPINVKYNTNRINDVILKCSTPCYSIEHASLQISALPFNCTSVYV